MHKVALQSLGMSPDLACDDPSIPASKVSNITTDSANVMQSTTDYLTQDYSLFKDMTFSPCSVHWLNLVLQDMVSKHPSFGS